ncbi:MAG: hypothetical protein ACUVRX_09620 [Actinomycetota bacterium]
MGVTRIRFRAEDRGFILCGLCVRMCKEQMQAGAIGFASRGTGREVAMPFHSRSEVCRECGVRLYVFPVCELHSPEPLQPGQLCNSCLDTVNLEAFPSRE